LPQILTPEQLASEGGPIAAGLLPAWRVTWVVLSQAEIDSLDERKPGPNLAIVKTLPERRMATVNIVSPWPDGESLSETLNHELGHVWISPITAQIPGTEASVMLEEQLVETLGVYLASLGTSARAAARRALRSIVDELAPVQMRARIAARAGLRARGAGMDPEKIKALIAAIKEQDGEAALQIAEGLLVEAASGGAEPATMPGEPDGDEPPMAEQAKPGENPMEPKPKPAAGPSPAPATPAEPPGRMAARIAAIEGEHSRARKAADAAVGITVRARLREVKASGLALDTALEERLGKMTDLEAFEQRIADIEIGRKLASPGGTRARTAVPSGAPVQHQVAPPPSEAPAPPVDADTLRAEGIDDSAIAVYLSTAEHDAKMGTSNAAAMLAGFRDPAAARARKMYGSSAGLGRRTPPALGSGRPS
jgi:hypothetical protein